VKAVTKGFLGGLVVGAGVMLVGAVYSVNSVSRMHYALDAISANPSYFANVQAAIEAGEDEAAIASLKAYSMSELANTRYAACAAEVTWHLSTQTIMEQCGHHFSDFSGTRPADFEIPGIDRARELRAKRQAAVP